ncbi:MAG: hypothetical protein Q7S31_02585 [bacterium]|nr:hypothetical protein [bacterium]
MRWGESRTIVERLTIREVVGIACIVVGLASSTRDISTGVMLIFSGIVIALI